MARVLVLLALVSMPLSAAEIVHLDGSRERSERIVVKDDFVLVAFEKGMRRVPKSKIAMVVQDDGSRIPLDRALDDAAPTPALEADLKGLATSDSTTFLTARQRLAASPNRAVFAGLLELANSKETETRARAGEVLAGMGVPESVDAAVAIALQDKSASVRSRVASSLFGIAGLVEAHDWKSKLRPGLEHKDQQVRAAFALVLGMAGDAEAIPVLKRDALRNRDHHMRESAAETLARLGDDAGVDLLVKMLQRKQHPGGDAILVAEQIRVCGHLEKLGGKKALPALGRATRSTNAELAAAAKRAADAIRARQAAE